MTLAGKELSPAELVAVLVPMAISEKHCNVCMGESFQDYS